MKRSFLQLAGFMSMLLVFSTFTSCEDGDGDAPNLSENAEAREDVYEQILNDEQLFSEFVDEMGENEMAMENFSNNQRMSQRMYGSDRMNRMMRDNPQMRDSMMHGMMMGMQRDTTHKPTPQMRQRMLQHIEMMMQRDSTFSREVREMVNNPATGTAAAQ